MEISNRHLSEPDPTLWTGRSDGAGAFRYHEVVQCTNKIPTDAICLIGFACDEGIIRNQGRSGAKEGPNALRKSLAAIPLPEGANTPIYDLGNIVCEDKNLEESQKQLASLIAQVLKAGSFPCVLGGGHEVTYAHFLALKEAFPGKALGILNFDAHYDIRKPNPFSTSGTSFYQIAEEISPFHYTVIGIQSGSNTPALFQTARNFGVKTVFASEIHQHGLCKAHKAIDDLLQKIDRLYVTFCLDVIAAPFAPGVSAPQPLGLYPAQIFPLLKHVRESDAFISFDIAELSPPLDIDSHTARLAAHLTAYTLKSKLISS